jgi:hypothetical protein
VRLIERSHVWRRVALLVELIEGEGLGVKLVSWIVSEMWRSIVHRVGLVSLQAVVLEVLII